MSYSPHIRLVIVLSTFILLFVGTLTQKTDTAISPLSQLSTASFFTETSTAFDLRNRYSEAVETASSTIKLLLVPGHDRDFPGTRFNGLDERDLNRELSGYLYEFLAQEEAFTVILAQNEEGYHPELAQYFVDERDSIKTFIKNQHGIMDFLNKDGIFETDNGIVHNTAPNVMVHRLYGINKWANENDVDIVIHIHFNDEPTRRWKRPGKYTGFTIYTPAHHYSNSRGSNDLAQWLFTELKDRSLYSDHPQEKAGIVPSSDLIAIGANNTLEAAGVLIEYGYIYERQFTDREVRSRMLKELALQTYKGILGFLANGEQTETVPQTTLLPHAWHTNIGYGLKGNSDVLGLQALLQREGLYPPRQFGDNSCPINGTFLACTKQSVKQFQRTYNIPPTGYVGPLTRERLNNL